MSGIQISEWYYVIKVANFQVYLLKMWKRHHIRWHIINNVHSMLSLSYSACQYTLIKDLHMRQMAAKFVPCLLNDNQKQN
jgi:hypothetical protein